MANLQLTELPKIVNTRANDLLYDVQGGVSTVLSLSTLFTDIPVDISLGTGNSIISGGSEITETYNSTYAPINDARVREEIGQTTFPGSNALSGFGNTTVAISGASGAITVQIPIEGNGCPLENFEMTFIQTGPARLEFVPDDPTLTTLFGTGSGLKGPNTPFSLESGSLSSHKTPGIFSSMKLVKLPSSQGSNRWLALTATG